METFFIEDKILEYVYHARAKLAKKRSKRQIIHSLASTSSYCNYKDRMSAVSCSDETLLNKILPPRSKWKKLDKKSRIVKGQKINSIKNVEETLRLTVNCFKKKFPHEPFLIELREFIDEVQDGLKDSYRITKPEIIPSYNKENGEIKCRPISQYSLKDRIIIALTNKYLTSILDSQFSDCSFAFRKSKCRSNELPHHHAIREICNHKALYPTDKWWVAECDIKKFYDSVNHSIIKQYFKKIIHKAESDTGKRVDERAINIFYKYLDSYSFFRDVYLKNNDNEYKLKHKLPPGAEFKWVINDLIDQNFYKRINAGSRIGVPQGGALSGLIANIVLHQADLSVLKTRDKLLGYYRYCDDILIFHPNKQITDNALIQYTNALKKLKLVGHDFAPLDVTNKKDFWKCKSKSSYEWSNDPSSGMEWVGFLGYEIKNNNDIRVRIRSIEKEKTKQQRTVNNVYKAIKLGKRKTDDTIIESVTHQLIGMAVGRVQPYNYEIIAPDMCWVNGFKEINNNTSTRKELKSLDRNRQKQLTWLKYELKKEAPAIFTSKSPIVPKLAFTRIKGIKKQDSIEIREQLKREGILTSKYRLQIQLEEISDSELTIPEPYRLFKNEILIILSNLKKNRCVGYYGSPYSYYYQALKNK